MKPRPYGTPVLEELVDICKTYLSIDRAADTARACKNLRRVRNRDGIEKCLLEAESQIMTLLLKIESIEATALRDCVLLLVSIGDILNVVIRLVENKDKYAEWVRMTFQGQHRRYFEHARQLATQKAFVRENADLGKNRLLDLIRAGKVAGRRCEQLLADYPCKDVNRRKENADAVITYYRLRAAPDVQFQHAECLVAAKGRALRVAEASQMIDSLQRLPEGDRAAALADLSATHGTLLASPQSPADLDRALQAVMDCLNVIEEEADLDESTTQLATVVIKALSAKLGGQGVK